MRIAEIILLVFWTLMKLNQRGNTARAVLAFLTVILVFLSCIIALQWSSGSIGSIDSNAAAEIQNGLRIDSAMLFSNGTFFFNVTNYWSESYYAGFGSSSHMILPPAFAKALFITTVYLEGSNVTEANCSPSSASVSPIDPGEISSESCNIKAPLLGGDVYTV